RMGPGLARGGGVAPRPAAAILARPATGRRRRLPQDRARVRRPAEVGLPARRRRPGRDEHAARNPLPPPPARALRDLAVRRAAAAASPRDLPPPLPVARRPVPERARARRGGVGARARPVEGRLAPPPARSALRTRGPNLAERRRLRSG